MVRASSWTASQPASLAWYPVIEIGLNSGEFQGAELDHVGDQPQRRAGGIQVRLAGQELLEYVVLQGAGQRARRHAPGARRRPGRWPG